ncbi:uncharacterized protein LOC112538897 [Tetranychus urticae]|uniref:Gustatory receptor n=1 Tax=Tetranychus urticae TaxID=32264 RepID=T1KAL5_TETUR|nr:uncharacterized protein LOC112538897 [Tetranychus urticae]
MMFRITTLDGRSSCSKPIGLLASMLRFEGRKSEFTSWFFIFSLIYVILNNIWLLRTKTVLETCFQCLYLINLNVILFWYLKLRSTKKQYSQLIYRFENQTHCNLDNSESTRRFTSIRNIFSFYFVFVMLFGAFCVAYDPIMTFKKSNDYVQLGQNLLLSLLNLLCLLNPQLYNQFLVESCLHIHACWFTVNEYIRLLNNIDSRLLTIDKVRKVRSMYSIAADVTEKMNSFLRMPIFVFFNYLIISSFENIVQVWTVPTVFGIIHILLDLLILTLITYNTIYIHYLSNECFHDVYSLSYKMRSVALNNEVQLFLYRILRSDVGFSFLKISLITPTFVTSLTSALLTFVLSLPSLV